MNPNDKLLRNLSAAAQPLATRISSERPMLEEIESRHRPLVLELASYSRKSTMPLVAALLTLPTFHANTLRLEMLQLLLHRNATGRRLPTRSGLSRWLNRGLCGGNEQMEDPVEDVFVSNVVCHQGNCRVFEGIWEGNDFCLQQALDVLRVLAREKEEAERLLMQCEALLVVSERAAERCGLVRYCMGGGEAKSALALPPLAELERRSRLLVFTPHDLDELEIPLEWFSSFIHPASATQGAWGDSTLEHFPLVQFEDELLLALPSAVSPAIRHHILSTATACNFLEDFRLTLIELEKLSLRDTLKHLGGERIVIGNISTPTPQTGICHSEVRQFDTDKFALVLLLSASSTEMLEPGLVGIDSLTGDGASAVIEYVKHATGAVEAQSTFQSGIVLFIAGGLGRSRATPIPDLPERWYFTGTGIHDFKALAMIKGMSLLMLWKIQHQERAIEKKGFNIANVNGLLNLVGCWEQNGQRLVPVDMDFSNSGRLLLTTDFVAMVRQRLRTKHNIHAVQRSHPPIWSVVRRYTGDALLEREENAEIYADLAAVKFGRLCGVRETAVRPYWVIHGQNHELQWHVSIANKVWRAILHWVDRLALLADSTFPNLPAGPVEIVFKFEGLSEWKTQNILDAPKGDEDIRMSLIRERSVIQLLIPAPFLNRFSTPKNVAERELVRMIFVGLAQLGNAVLSSDDIETLVQKVIGNDDARHFHIAIARDYRQTVGDDWSRNPRFILENDTNTVCLGLSHSILGKSLPEKINGATECNSFLHKVVDRCWEFIRQRLKTVDRLSVVRRCLENIEAIEIDKEHWRLTARALLAMYCDEQSEITEVSHKRDQRRAPAEITSRVLIEMAICVSPASGAKAIGEADFDFLLATFELLIGTAGYSDAINRKMAPPEITIYPNGEFRIDDSYQHEIILPYLSGGHRIAFNAAADEYEKHFVLPGGAHAPQDGESESAPISSLSVEFRAAFSAEYGITPERLADIVNILQHDGSKNSEIVAVRSLNELTSILKAEDVSESDINGLINNFAMRPRERWDSTPSGFSKKDWEPWRYRRRLSLIARPFVLIEETDNPTIIYAPGFVEQAVSFLVTRLLHGDLPNEQFRSDAMRSFIGNRNQKLGREFESNAKEEFVDAGLWARASILMTEFGADESYGDLDVLAWDEKHGVFYAVECKRLRPAMTTGEIGEQLRAFEGEEGERIRRHTRRCNWLRSHEDKLFQVVKIRKRPYKILPLLVTNTLVPMQFTSEAKSSGIAVVPFDDIKDFVGKQS